MPPDSFQTTDRLLTSLQSLPWGVHGGVALALLAGLVLWACGRSVLKPVTVLVSTVGAAIGGFLLLPTLAPGAGVSPYVGGLGGAVIGVLAGLLLYRLALCTVLAIVGAMLAGLVSAALLGTPTPSLTGPTIAAERVPDVDAAAVADEGAAWTMALLAQEPAREDEPMPDGPSDGPANEQQGPDIPDPTVPAGDPLQGLSAPKTTAELLEAAGQARDFVVALQARFTDAWRALPATHQLIIAGAGLIGFLLGAVMGLALPAWSAGAVTAFAGAAVWLPAAGWLAHAAALPVSTLTDLPPSGLVVVWGVVGLVGLGLQWAGLIRGRRRVKKVESEKGAGG